MSKPNIVMLGAGLGGAIAAFEIKQAVGARRRRDRRLAGRHLPLRAVESVGRGRLAQARRPSR